MLEVRFHGRGGQGTVIAANMLAVAAFNEGHFVQSFPLFGGERRGSPVSAFARIDEKPIAVRSQIYAPDHVLVLDPTLIGIVDVTVGLKDEGWLIINSEQSPSELGLSRRRALSVDASAITQRHGLGTQATPVVNSAVLGALVRTTGLVSLASLLEAVREESPSNKEANVEAAREAYDIVGRIEVINICQS